MNEAERKELKKTTLKYLETLNSVLILNAAKDTDCLKEKYASNLIEENEIIEFAKGIDRDIKYRTMKVDGYGWIAFHNPDYKYLNSGIETNRNIRRSNRVIAVASIATGVFALSAILVSIFSFINSEKLKPELIKLNNTLQMQEQILKRLEPSLINLNRSIQNVADSLPK